MDDFNEFSYKVEFLIYLFIGSIVGGTILYEILSLSGIEITRWMCIAIMFFIMNLIMVISDEVVFKKHLKKIKQEKHKLE